MSERVFQSMNLYLAACEKDPEGRDQTLVGLSPGAVGAFLNCSRQRIAQLIGEGRLDTVRVLDGRGKLMVLMITKASIDRELHGRYPDLYGPGGELLKGRRVPWNKKLLA